MFRSVSVELALSGAHFEHYYSSVTVRSGFVRSADPLGHSVKISQQCEHSRNTSALEADTWSSAKQRSQTTCFGAASQ